MISSLIDIILSTPVLQEEDNLLPMKSQPLESSVSDIKIRVKRRGGGGHLGGHFGGGHFGGGYAVGGRGGALFGGGGMGRLATMQGLKDDWIVVVLIGLMISCAGCHCFSKLYGCSKLCRKVKSKYQVHAEPQPTAPSKTILEITPTPPATAESYA